MSDDFESEMDAILLEQLINWCEFNEMNWHRALARLVNDRERLRAERDEARWEICLLRASSTNATEKLSAEMAEYALSRGWDCFNKVKP